MLNLSLKIFQRLFKEIALVISAVACARFRPYDPLSTSRSHGIRLCLGNGARMYSQMHVRASLSPFLSLYFSVSISLSSRMRTCTRIHGRNAIASPSTCGCTTLLVRIDFVRCGLYTGSRTAATCIHTYMYIYIYIYICVMCTCLTF